MEFKFPMGHTDSVTLASNARRESAIRQARSIFRNYPTVPLRDLLKHEGATSINILDLCWTQHLRGTLEKLNVTETTQLLRLSARDIVRAPGSGANTSINLIIILILALGGEYIRSPRPEKENRDRLENNHLDFLSFSATKADIFDRFVNLSSAWKSQTKGVEDELAGLIVEEYQMYSISEILGLEEDARTPRSITCDDVRPYCLSARSQKLLANPKLTKSRDLTKTIVGDFEKIPGIGPTVAREIITALLRAVAQQLVDRPTGSMETSF
ncbi:hypothetical protein ACRYCC_35385 [Actinomadura scrupuli]|uniref:hypothetical protein n=1 Tax=Actinomadura scrupuli TaxID=559629 RepID=UPI003D96FF6B